MTDEDRARMLKLADDSEWMLRLAGLWIESKPLKTTFPIVGSPDDQRSLPPNL